MSATTVWAGLQERFATLGGLKANELGEPSSINAVPALYSAYERFETELSMQVPATVHYFVHRLYLRWQDFPRAEAELLTWINAVINAVAADRHLGGRLTRGTATIASGQTGFVTVGSTKYRVVDFTSKTTEK